MNTKERLNNNFDFLRLFAALAITYTHSFGLLNKIDSESLIIITNKKVNFSFVGLCLFFSISGYLIAKSASTSLSIKNYLWKRFLRIQPLLIVLCFTIVFIIGPACTSLTLKEYFSNFRTWSYFRNVMPVFGIQFSQPGVFLNNIKGSAINGSLWTLVVEERLYMLFILPFFLSAFKK